MNFFSIAKINFFLHDIYEKGVANHLDGFCAHLEEANERVAFTHPVSRTHAVNVEIDLATQCIITWLGSQPAGNKSHA